jgi:hypothetical protein
MNKIAIVLGFFQFLLNSAGAMPPINRNVELPPYIQAITKSDSLNIYLNSQQAKDKIAACIRLGEIGDENDINKLIFIVNNDPYLNSIDVVSQLRYYSILSIGKIGGSKAETFLRKLIDTISFKIKAGTNSFTRADSLNTVVAAIEGLSESGIISNKLFLDSVFNNNENNWLVRSRANLSSLKIEFKNNTSLKNANDTSQFLISKWRNVPWETTQFSTQGVNVDYLVRINIETLLYDYRSSTLPYLIAYEKTMNPLDPRTETLKKLIRKMDLQNH